MSASRVLIPAGILLLAFTTGGMAQESNTSVRGEWKTMDNPASGQKFSLSPVQSTIELVEGTGRTSPEGYQDTLFGMVEHGGQQIGVVLGRGAGDKGPPDQVWVDLNGNSAVDDGEHAALENTERKLRDGRTGWSGLANGLWSSLGDNKAPFSVSYSQFGDAEPRLRLLTLWYMEGRFELEGKSYALLFQDSDGDGAFGGDEDRWGILPADQVGEQRLRSTSLMANGEGVYLDGCRIVARAGEDLSIEVGHAPAAGPDPQDLAQARERVEHDWAARFDKERDQFIKDRELDTSRPVTTDPIQWRWVTFDEALALSEKEGKALFIDVMAYWCVWCYRMDYYTYPDAEVAKLLNEKFLPVKIIQEQDFVGDYDRIRELLGARGIPAMGVFRSDGIPVKMISGWKKPEDFLTELHAALEKYQG